MRICKIVLFGLIVYWFNSLIPSVSALDQPIVGAIRWDAWVGQQSTVGTSVEKQLSPAKWQSRVPFFGNIISSNQVEIRGYTQPIIDQEITYAHRAGLDYWAFDLYPPADPMTQALNLYLSSSRVHDLNFTFIVGPAIFQNDVQRLISLMQKPSYQKVLGNRPLVFFHDFNPPWIASWGDWVGSKAKVDAFRTATQNAGLGNPYIVMMRFWSSVQQEKDYVSGLGADAVSRYLVGSRVENGSYTDLTAEAKRIWELDKTSGAGVVPTLTTGLDSRPKIEIPNAWGTPPDPLDVKYFYQQPTPPELAKHVQDGLDWMRSNPTSSPAQAAIIYAWNENVEGGWLTPTLGEGTTRLDAIATVLGGSSNLAGDLDGDGHANVLDYDLILSKFGNPYTIFDYNHLVTNYGK